MARTAAPAAAEWRGQGARLGYSTRVHEGGVAPHRADENLVPIRVPKPLTWGVVRAARLTPTARSVVWRRPES